MTTRAQTAVFETLKQRKNGVFRAVPLPEHFLNMLNQVHNLKRRQERPREKNQYIWTGIWKGKAKQWTRKTAYSRVMEVMEGARLNGLMATPKGLRHGFAIACLDKNVPLTLVQKWMGHTSITTTAIYANASGEEERNIAARLWGET